MDFLSVYRVIIQQLVETAYPAITRTESFVLLSAAHRYSILVILDNFKPTKLKSYTGRPRLNRCESLCLCKVRELVAF